MIVSERDARGPEEHEKIAPIVLTPTRKRVAA
jgi:hypothetical protein